MLCFAATSVATLYHYLLGWPAPYDLPSLPKLLGGWAASAWRWAPPACGG
jgi:hypothetical protein